MADKNQDAEIWQGQDVILDFTISGVDPTTGAGFSYGISYGSGDAAEILEKTLGSGVTAPDATSVLVELDAADTVNLEPRGYHHELWINDASGNWVPLADGDLTVRGSAVR